MSPICHTWESSVSQILCYHEFLMDAKILVTSNTGCQLYWQKFRLIASTASKLETLGTWRKNLPTQSGHLRSTCTTLTPPKKPQICELQQNDFGVVAILYKNGENWSKHLTCLKLHTNPNDGTYPLIYYQPEFGGDMVGSGSSVHS